MKHHVHIKRLILSAILFVMILPHAVYASDLPVWNGVAEESGKRDDREDDAGTAVSYVMINTGTEQVVAFDENNKPLKVFACSTGIHGNTVTGTFRTSDYYEWHLMNGGVYSRYAVRFNNHELMHSVPYYRHSPDSLEYKQYNRLGSPASAGCCRMAVADAKWIYENTVPGTTVKVVHDPDLVYRLSHPIIRINEDDEKKRGWDPTDTDPRSPYNVVRRRPGSDLYR